jgi:glucokinase
MAPKNKKRIWIGFDLGGTKMLANVFDADYGVLGRARKKTQSKNGGKSALERIIATIDEALQASGLRRDDIAGIGVGVPGPVNPAHGMVIHAPNLGWRDFQLRKPLEEQFGCPAFVVNDVDAGAFGEYRFGAARNARCAVGIFPGTGIGGGCVYEGRIVSGKTCSCFEIGHIQVVPDGPLCGCGRRGCLEAVASRLAIAAAAAAAAYRGEAPNLAEAVGADVAAIRSGALAEAVKAGDKVIEEIVRNAARWLGVGVATVVNLLAPDVIVLGGGLVEAMPEIYRSEVTAVVRERAMPAFVGVYQIKVSELGDDAVSKGAAAWAEENAGLS